jgi:alcohol dehydrogenase
MGAARVVACGRNENSLQSLVEAVGRRVSPVVLSGNVDSDSAAIRSAAGGGIQMGFDMVGGAADPSATLSALRSLQPRGRLVLMGSMSVPLPLSYMEVMANSWELIGNFMYPNDACLRLLNLVRSGLLDFSPVRPRTFKLPQLPEAMLAAAHAGSLECIVMQS